MAANPPPNADKTHNKNVLLMASCILRSFVDPLSGKAMALPD
jgi:hypothetical protein